MTPRNHAISCEAVSAIARGFCRNANLYLGWALRLLDILQEQNRGGVSSSVCGSNRDARWSIRSAQFYKSQFRIQEIVSIRIPKGACSWSCRMAKRPSPSTVFKRVSERCTLVGMGCWKWRHVSRNDNTFMHPMLPPSNRYERFRMIDLVE